MLGICGRTTNIFNKMVNACILLMMKVVFLCIHYYTIYNKGWLCNIFLKGKKFGNIILNREKPKNDIRIVIIYFWCVYIFQWQNECTENVCVHQFVKLFYSIIKSIELSLSKYLFKKKKMESNIYRNSD